MSDEDDLDSAVNQEEQLQRYRQEFEQVAGRDYEEILADFEEWKQSGRL